MIRCSDLTFRCGQQERPLINWPAIFGMETEDEGQKFSQENL